MNECKSYSPIGVPVWSKRLQVLAQSNLT